MHFSELTELLSVIEFHDWEFRCGTLGDGYYIQVQFKAPDTCTNQEADWNGRKWYVSKFATQDEVVLTCFKAVMTAVEHETREHFLFHGKAIFNPHPDVGMLLKLADQRVYRT